MDKMAFLGQFDNLTTSPNSTSFPPSGDGPAFYILMSLFILVNVLSIVGNVLILRVIPKIPHTIMEDSSKVFYKCLALTDAIAAIVYTIGAVFGILTNGRLVIFCRVIGFVMTIFPGSSVLQLALLNTDRYLFIVKPMIYSRFVTRKLAIAACVTVTVFNSALLFLFVTFNEISFDILRWHNDLKACIVDFQEETFLPFSLGMFIMPWSVMLGLVIQYCHIFIISARHWNRIKPRKSSIEKINKVPSVESSGDGSSEDSSAAPSTSDPMENAINTEQVMEKFGHLSRRDIYEEDEFNNMATKSSGESPVGEISNRPCRPMSHRNKTQAFESDFTEHLGADQPGCKNHLRTTAASGTSHGSMDKHQKHHLDAEEPRSTIKQGQRSKFRQNMRVLRTPLIITSCYFFSFLPPTFLNMYLGVKGQTIDSFFHAMFTTLVAVNGCVNIIVYYFTIKPFRDILKDMLRRR